VFCRRGADPFERHGAGISTVYIVLILMFVNESNAGVLMRIGTGPAPSRSGRYVPM